MLTPPAWVTSIDLQDAYFHVPIKPTLHKYLAFLHEGNLFFFRALPFGLNVAPYIFSRILRYPLGLLHQQGIAVLAYLDDWIIWGASPSQTRDAFTITVDTLQRLGFLINEAKSQPIPLYDAEWLGVRWLSLEGRWGIPMQKQQEVRLLIHKFFGSHTCSRREWETLLGTLNFISHILSHSRHLLQPLLKPQLLGNPSSRDTQVPLPSHLRQALLPWLHPALLERTEPFLFVRPPVLLWTDASLLGWGGHTDHALASGQWHPHERNLHINILEVRAVRYTVLKLLPSNLCLHLFIDNAPAQCAINRLSCRSHALRKELSLLIRVLRTHNLTIRAFRISSLLNAKADALSRSNHTLLEWELPQETFQRLLLLRGPLEIDLMATNKNAKLPLYLSPHPDPQAVGHNALAWDWNLWSQIYLFPPKWLIPTVFTKLQAYRGHGLIILPWYPAEPWFPYIQGRSLHHWHLSLADATRGGRPALERWTAFNF